MYTNLCMNGKYTIVLRSYSSELPTLNLYLSKFVLACTNIYQTLCILLVNCNLKTIEKFIKGYAVIESNNSLRHWHPWI